MDKVEVIIMKLVINKGNSGELQSFECARRKGKLVAIVSVKDFLLEFRN